MSPPPFPFLLSQVEVCYGHDGQGNPTYRIACPENMLNDDYDNSCATHQDKEIYVTSFAS